MHNIIAVHQSHYHTFTLHIIMYCIYTKATLAEPLTLCQFLKDVLLHQMAAVMAMLSQQTLERLRTKTGLLLPV